MASFNHISGQEPSTVSFKVATVTQVRNSTTMHQELLSISDAQSSLGVARVVAAPPASTEYGLVVRIASGPSSAADLVVSGNSTVFQGTSPWTIAGNSTVIQGTSPWVISGNSTVIQGTSPWIIGGDSTLVFKPGYISSAAQSGNSSGLTVRPVWSSTNADQPVSIAGNSTVIQGTSPWIIGGDSTIVFKPGYISSVVQTGNSSGLTVRPVWSSSNADQPVSIAGNSTAFQGGTWNINTVTTVSSLAGIIAVRPSDTAWLSSAGAHFDSSGGLQVTVVGGGSTQIGITAGGVLEGSSKAGGISTRYGLAVREQQIDSTYATGMIAATSTGDVSLISSVAAKSIYVYHWSGQIVSTGAGSTFRLMSGSTQVMWQIHSANLVQWNLSVTPPQYLWRTASAANLAISKAGSSLFSAAYNVSVWQE